MKLLIRNESILLHAYTGDTSTIDKVQKIEGWGILAQPSHLLGYMEVKRGLS
jgi:hypothetical protein